MVLDLSEKSIDEIVFYCFPKRKLETNVMYVIPLAFVKLYINPIKSKNYLKLMSIFVKNEIVKKYWFSTFLCFCLSCAFFLRTLDPNRVFSIFYMQLINFSNLESKNGEILKDTG